MADIHQPHDRLFRGVFADPKEAAGLLQATLPPDIRDSFDWTTLALRSGTFIDENFAQASPTCFFRWIRPQADSWYPCTSCSNTSPSP